MKREMSHVLSTPIAILGDSTDWNCSGGFFSTHTNTYAHKGSGQNGRKSWEMENAILPSPLVVLLHWSFFLPPVCATHGQRYQNLSLFFFLTASIRLLFTVTIALAQASGSDRLARRPELKCLKCVVCVGKGLGRSAVLSSMPLRSTGRGVNTADPAPFFKPRLPSI